MDTTALLQIVMGTLRDVDGPIHVEDNSRPRRISYDPIEMVADSPPAYCVCVSVNGCPLGSFPWVSVTYTERFGFPPIGPMDEVYTYLSPPIEVDREDAAAVKAWLTPALREAVEARIPLARAARLADADKPGPIEARDAIRRIG